MILSFTKRTVGKIGIGQQSSLLRFRYFNIASKQRNFSCTEQVAHLSDIRYCKQVAQMASPSLPLQYIVEKLNSFAPSALAESWDNVGLLIEPATPQPISGILLTNDLTEAVMQEAVELSVNMIISYHPPIFAPLKSVTTKTWKERIVALCLENKIALYSPHTSFDAVKGGVNDWLCSAFETEWVKPILQSYIPGNYLLEITIPCTSSTDDAVAKLQSQLEKCCPKRGDEPIILNKLQSHIGTVVQVQCSKNSLPIYEECVLNCFMTSDDYQLSKTKYEEIPLKGHGMGRLCLLATPLPVEDVVDKVKKLVNLPHLRLARAVGKNTRAMVSTIALCAGSGASVLKKIHADLFLTGEMFHHDILDAIHQGTHVILTNHSDSERGFLVNFAKILENQLLEGKVQVFTSKCDSDPLKTV